MANTTNGIYYPNNYEEVSDVPADFKKMAESIDVKVEELKQKDENCSNKITVIEIKQATHNTELEQLKSENEILKNSLPSGGITSETITLTDSAEMIFKKFDILGNSKQDGEPIDIKCCGDNINLFNKDDTTQYQKNVYIDGAGSCSNAYTNGTYSVIFPCKENTTYAISKVASSKFRIGVLEKIPEAIAQTVSNFKVNDTATFITTTTTSGAKYLIVSYYHPDTDTLTEIEIRNSIKIVEGTQTGSYSDFGQGSIDIRSCNKNKFNKNTVVSGKYIGADGNIQSQEGISYSDYIFVEPNKNYYFGDRGTWVSVAQYNKNKEFISRITIPIGTYQFSEDVKFIRCNIDNTYLNTFQLEEGTTLTEYVEHKEQSYTMPTQQPFRKIEDYEDTFVKQNGKWYEKHCIKKAILTGTENWFLSGTTTDEILVAALSFTGGLEEAMLSNYFIYNKDDVLALNSVAIYNNKLTLKIVVDRSEFTDLEAFKAWLAEKYSNDTPVEVYYVLETPELIECTVEQNEILDQIENKAQTYKNITHIYSTDEVAPIFDLEYFKDIETLIANTLVEGV